MGTRAVGPPIPAGIPRSLPYVARRQPFFTRRGHPGCRPPRPAGTSPCARSSGAISVAVNPAVSAAAAGAGLLGDLALDLALADGGSLVMQLLAAAEPDLELDPPLLEV